MTGRVVRRATYMQEYHELTHKQGVPFVPNAVWKDIIFSGCATHYLKLGFGGAHTDSNQRLM